MSSDEERSSSNTPEDRKETLFIQILPEDDSDLKIYVSFHAISFFSNPADRRDGFLVGNGVYLSPLVRLLYVRNAKAGDQFELAKAQARKVLIDFLVSVRSVLEKEEGHSEEIELIDTAASLFR